MDSFIRCLTAMLLTFLCFYRAANGLGSRPFLTPSTVNCSTEQRMSGLGCPCKLPNVPCKEPTSFCLRGTCQYSQLTATPSVPSITAPCGLQVTKDENGIGRSEPIPGLNITFSGGVGPLMCNTVTDQYTVGPKTVNVIADFLDNMPTEPFALVPIDPYYSSFLFIDGYTGEVTPYVYYDPRYYKPDIGAPLPTQLVAATTLVSFLLQDSGYYGPSTLDTQIYSGYCIDARGVHSNVFTFQVTYTLCPDATGDVPNDYND